LADNQRHIFTSESVTEGHPDKIADQISDAVLDAVLADDPMGRVACEVLVTTGTCIVAGEITTKTYVDVQRIARGTIDYVGYNDATYGFDASTCGVHNLIQSQSPDISMGVDTGGAGDQGLMFGYACDETPDLMPAPLYYAQRILQLLAQARHAGDKRLGPDSKSQVTVQYKNGKPVAATQIVVSHQHLDESLTSEDMRKIIEPHVRKALPKNWINKHTVWHINPTGSFVIGGPDGDCGLTGRKIIVDTYGGMARHGGGAFSGKDPSKVDRSAAYATRWVAKNIVAAGLAERAEVQVAYAIGVAHPVSVMVETFGTEQEGRTRGQIARAVDEVFDLRPGAFREELKLHRPIYQKTAAYGHFGRDDHDFTWERTDKAAALRSAAGL